jgi:hypothetical protein
VRVDGTTVPHAPQPFAIAVTGSLGDWPPQTGAEVDGTTGLPFRIEGISPNPFNPSARITYSLLPAPTGQARTTLRIISVDGRVVTTLVDRVQDPGRYDVTWDGRDSDGLPVASGIYFCDLSYGGAKETRKLTLLK